MAGSADEKRAPAQGPPRSPEADEPGKAALSYFIGENDTGTTIWLL